MLLIPYILPHIINLKSTNKKWCPFEGWERRWPSPWCHPKPRMSAGWSWASFTGYSIHSGDFVMGFTWCRHPFLLLVISILFLVGHEMPWKIIPGIGKFFFHTAYSFYTSDRGNITCLNPHSFAVPFSVFEPQSWLLKLFPWLFFEQKWSNLTPHFLMVTPCPADRFHTGMHPSDRERHQGKLAGRV